MRVAYPWDMTGSRPHHGRIDAKRAGFWSAYLVALAPLSVALIALTSH
jgi:hypothetical protein